MTQQLGTQQLGADVEGLDRLALRFDGTAETADGVRLALTRMADELMFSGRYGEEFRTYLRTTAAPAVGAAAEALRQLGTVARGQAAGQREVSAGAGLATFAAPALACQQAPAPPRVGDRTAPDEGDTVGDMTARVQRNTPEFNAMVNNTNPDIVFKDEEIAGQPRPDHMMTQELSDRLDALATSVSREWPGLHLRVTEAWDENNEHGTPRGVGPSLHYEGRAADITVSDRDPAKLARLYELAEAAGLGWVYYEDRAHVHVSVPRP